MTHPIQPAQAGRAPSARAGGSVQLIDPGTCSRGHRRTANTARKDPRGAWVCRVCRAIAAERRRQGLGGYVDSGPTIERLRMLRKSGMTTRQLAELSGLSDSQIIHLSKREYAHVWASTARIVAAIEPTPYPTALRNPIGAKRRLGALMLRGWTIRELAARAGLSGRALQDILNDQIVETTQATHEAICRLYDELWNSPVPPHPFHQYIRARAAREAEAAGHAPALAWDDHQIDDPAAKPAALPPCSHPGCGTVAHSGGLCNLHYKRARYGGGKVPAGVRAGQYNRDDYDELAVEVFLEGHRIALTHADAHQVIVRLLRRPDMTHNAIAARVGTSQKTVDRVAAEEKARAQAAAEDQDDEVTAA